LAEFFNVIALFLVGSLSLFFIRIYDIHMMVRVEQGKGGKDRSHGPQLIIGQLMGSSVIRAVLRERPTPNVGSGNL
jgi:hypothetical protein